MKKTTYEIGPVIDGGAVPYWLACSRDRRRWMAAARRTADAVRESQAEQGLPLTPVTVHVVRVAASGARELAWQQTL